MSQFSVNSESSPQSPPSPHDRSLSPFRGISPVNFLFEGCNEDGIIHFHRTRLESMMRMSKNGRFPSQMMHEYETKGLVGLENRARAIRWIRDVATVSEMSHDARECGVEIFDKFLMVSLIGNPNVYEDTVKLSFAAASAILISSKLHEGKSLLTMANFPGFDSKDLVAFEVMLLSKIGCQMNMLLAPSCFVRHLLGLFPEIEELHSVVIEAAHQYISMFQEQPAYLLFAPSTVAISALLISFSVYQVQSEVWLKTRIPDLCLPSENNPLNADNMLDVVKCLAYFEKVLPENKRKLPVNAEQAQERSQGSKGETRFQRSPTSVTSPIMGSPVNNNSNSSSNDGNVHSTSTNSGVGNSANKGGKSSVPGVSCLDLEAIETDAKHF